MQHLKEYLPPFLVRKLTGLFYGWSGNYSTWEEAKSKSTGYDQDTILERVKSALLKVKSGEAICERDSVIFEKIEYSFPILTSLLWIANQNGNQLNLIDFGGSLGSSYFQNKFFLSNLNVTWNIVEQEKFVMCGQENFQDEHLRFYKNIDACFEQTDPTVLLCSSVLQYIENPESLIKSFLEKNFEFVIIDRTPFIKRNDRITIQKVHPKIYQANYPCWFFNEEKFLNLFKEKYDLVTDFSSLDKSNIQSEFKGFLFRIKKY
jgi:putative methyltransferase (TIGR04325 family)